MQELPEIQKMIQTYARAKTEGLAVVALSVDREPDDPAEVRKLVEKTLKDKDLKLDVAPIGSVALDPANLIGEAFQVRGIPTVVILDAKGVVQSIHVGFSPDVVDTLTEEIGELLAGHSLVEPKEPPAKASK
jgi:hypothetical protein